MPPSVPLVTEPDAAAALRAAVRANRRSILCMCGAMACFVTNDALVKVVSGALSTSQLIFIRGLMASVLVLAVASGAGVLGRWRVLARPVVLGRASLDAIASMLYLVSLFHLPIANATAINLAAPIMLTLAAAAVLRERVGPARWLAVVGGFVGVLLVIQPASDGFNVYALVCLAGTLFHAGRDLMTRWLPADAPSLLVTLATALAVTVLTGLLSIVEGWRPVGWREIGLLAAAAVLLSVAYHLIILSLRTGDLSLVAPFRYSALLFAVLLGWGVWGDFPNPLAWLGIGLLLVSGLQVLGAERRRRMRAAAARTGAGDARRPAVRPTDSGS